MFTFNYTEFRNRNYGLQSDNGENNHNIAKPYQGRDYFGFPIEFSFSVIKNRITCLVHYNPRVLDDSVLEKIVEQFNKNVSYFTNKT